MFLSAEKKRFYPIKMSILVIALAQSDAPAMIKKAQNEEAIIDILSRC